VEKTDGPLNEKLNSLKHVERSVGLRPHLIDLACAMILKNDTIEELFRQFDRDKDGRLDLQEYEEAMKSLRI
jgi:hypothetical protein